ncbi:hypothetical protein Q9Q94_08515 [Uliginosibacterium sp. 31-16]|uniref:hypothetical protein n=1 Tax=Uliginosibacterium sp. 31-16 TaxID=3068315 RepID=UPI00273F6BBD|nr:hypothetical protein [Uliginosibacterium sp. 31-16]MDP5239570.1 hypothetical protein [Uliginosibacterium sp. 31-16]
MKEEITGGNRALTPDNKQHNLKIACALCTENRLFANKILLSGEKTAVCVATTRLMHALLLHSGPATKRQMDICTEMPEAPCWKPSFRLHRLKRFPGKPPADPSQKQIFRHRR